MTERQTVTCRSVCERLVILSTARSVDLRDGISRIASDARLALGQPDDLREAHDAVAQRLVEVQRQLDAANKRAEDAEAKLRELESATGKTIAQHGDIQRVHIQELEFTARWLLDEILQRWGVSTGGAS